VTAFRANHPPIEPALGFKVSFRGKTVVISGDTTATPVLAEQARNADMLVSEVMNMNYIEMAERIFIRNGYETNARIFRDIREYHIGTDELANLAESAGVRHLILTHLAPNLDNKRIMNSLFINPISRIYRGQLSMARDGDTFVLEL
jgi:ribonuclease Z